MRYRNNQILLFLDSLIFSVGCCYAYNLVHGKIYYNDSIDFLDILYPALGFTLFFGLCYIATKMYLLNKNKL